MRDECTGRPSAQLQRRANMGCCERLINQREKQIIREEGGGETRPLEQEANRRFRPRKAFTVQVPGSSSETESSNFRPEVGQANGPPEPGGPGA